MRLVVADMAEWRSDGDTLPDRFNSPREVILCTIS